MSRRLRRVFWRGFWQKIQMHCFGHTFTFSANQQTSRWEGGQGKINLYTCVRLCLPILHLVIVKHHFSGGQTLEKNKNTYCSCSCKSTSHLNEPEHKAVPVLSSCVFCSTGRYWKPEVISRPPVENDKIRTLIANHNTGSVQRMITAHPFLDYLIVVNAHGSQ